METKVCSKCGIEKNIIFFNRRKTHSKDGYCQQCKQCRSVIMPSQDINIQYQVCSKCGIEKNISDFYKRNTHSKTGYHKMCKLCKNEVIKIYAKKNRISVNMRLSKWKANNPIKNKIIEKNNRDNYIQNMKNHYVVSILKLKGFSKEDITPELIEVQRLLTQTKRLCKTSLNSETV